MHLVEIYSLDCSNSSAKNVQKKNKNPTKIKAIDLSRPN